MPTPNPDLQKSFFDVGLAVPPPKAIVVNESSSKEEKVTASDALIKAIVKSIATSEEGKAGSTSEEAQRASEKHAEISGAEAGLTGALVSKHTEALESESSVSTLLQSDMRSDGLTDSVLNSALSESEEKSLLQKREPPNQHIRVEAINHLVAEADLLADQIIKVHTLPRSSVSMTAYVLLLNRYQQVVNVVALAHRSTIEAVLTTCKQRIDELGAKQLMLYHVGQASSWPEHYCTLYDEGEEHLLRLCDQQEVLEKALGVGGK